MAAINRNRRRYRVAADLDRRERDEAIDEAIRLANEDAFGMVTVTKSADGFDVESDADDTEGFVNDAVDVDQYDGEDPDFDSITFDRHTPDDFEVRDAMNVTGWRELAPVRDFLAGRRDEVSMWAEPLTVWWTDGDEAEVNDNYELWVVCAD